MGEKSIKCDTNDSEITLSIPDHMRSDLKKIASLNSVSIDNLVFSYIVEGIAGDSRILKRAEFKHQATGNLKQDDFHSKSAREIVNEFNLLY